MLLYLTFKFTLGEKFVVSLKLGKVHKKKKFGKIIEKRNK